MHNESLSEREPETNLDKPEPVKPSKLKRIKSAAVTTPTGSSAGLAQLTTWSLGPRTLPLVKSARRVWCRRKTPSQPRRNSSASSHQTQK